MSLAATLTVDLEAIAANWRALDAMTAHGCETAAVVKADAYGCGAAMVGPVLAKAGVRTFFVAMMEEAFALRDVLGPGPVIYVFAGLSGHRGEIEEAHARDIRPVLNSREQLGFAAEMAAKLDGLKAALQIDTGMNRLGIEAPDLSALMENANASFANGRLSIDLVMSHMGNADDPGHPLNADQLRVFQEMVQGQNAILSLSATAGILLGGDYHFGLTRPGIGLYGGAPFDAGRHAVTVEVPVIQVRDLAPGETVGYGATFTAKRPIKIATISAGYADGLIRYLSQGATGFLRGQPVPFAGRVSMDLITLDVTDIDGQPCAAGDPIELIGPNQTIDALACQAGTIGHEILTALGSRYRRVYLDA